MKYFWKKSQENDNGSTSEGGWNGMLKSGGTKGWDCWPGALAISQAPGHALGHDSFPGEGMLFKAARHLCYAPFQGDV